VQLALASSN